MKRFVYTVVLGSMISGLATSVLSASSAATLQTCAAAHIGLESVVPPVARNVKEFYNNQVQLFNVDTMAPAATSSGIVIVIPDFVAEGGGSRCYALLGFGSIDVNNAQASYNPSRGLYVTIPTQNTSLTEDGDLVPGKPVSFLINLSRATVTVLHH